MLLRFRRCTSQQWPELRFMSATCWVCDLGLLCLSCFFCKNVSCNLCFIGRLGGATKIIYLESAFFFKSYKALYKC